MLMNGRRRYHRAWECWDVCSNSMSECRWAEQNSSISRGVKPLPTNTHQRLRKFLWSLCMMFGKDLCDFTMCIGSRLSAVSLDLNFVMCEKLILNSWENPCLREIWVLKTTNTSIHWPEPKLCFFQR